MGLLKSTLQGRLKEGRYPGRAARGGPQWVLDEHPIPSQQPWGAPGPLVPAPHHDLLSRAWGGAGFRWTTLPTAEQVAHVITKRLACFTP